MPFLRGGTVGALIVVLAHLALPTPGLAQDPAGAEFRVNTYTPGTQRLGASISAAADGSFVVVWSSSSGQDGSNYGIFGQRYDASGTPTGLEFLVNTYTSQAQQFPSVASAPDGRFVVVWTSSGQDGSGAGAYGQRFDASGAAVGSEFRLNTYTPNNQQNPSVAAAADGSFVVAWMSNTQDGSLYGVFGQRYDASGNALGEEFQVNTYITGDQSFPSVAAADDGRFVVVWQGSDADNAGVFGRRYDSAGAPQGPEFQINTYTTSRQYIASVSSAADGRFVVVWRSNGQDGSLGGIFGQRFDAAAVAQGLEFRANAHTTELQSRPSVSSAADGSFVVAWESRGQTSGGSYDIFGRRFDAAGNPQAEFRVNTHTTSRQTDPAVAAAPDGRFVVAWSSYLQDGSLYGVFGQRYQGPPDLIFADGFES